MIDAEDDDVFAPEPTTLWHDVLRRQTGALQWVANFPDDPQTTNQLAAGRRLTCNMQVKRRPGRLSQGAG